MASIFVAVFACFLSSLLSIRGAPASPPVPTFYTIALPKALRPDTQHTIAVEYGTQDIVFQINSINPKSKLEIKGNPAFLPNGIGSIIYQIPFDKYQEDKIILTMSFMECPSSKSCAQNPGKTIMSTENVTLPVLKKTVLTFIETSKPIYKPGEKIKFRVLSIYPDTLLPTPPNSDDKTTTKFDLIYLQAPNKMRLAQWRNVDWLKALKGLSFDLSADPILGQWKIVTEMDSEKDEETFTVKKYVLPRFTVSLKLPSYVFVASKSLRFEVCAKYSTGLPMKASVNATFCIKSKYSSSKSLRPCITVSGKTDGLSSCLPFTINTKKLSLTDSRYPYWSASVHVSANVTEKGTNATVSKSEYGGQLTQSPFKIINKSPDTYYRGLPFYGQVQTVNHDGTPRPKVALNAYVDSFWRYGWGYQANYTSDENGIVNFEIPPFPEQTTKVWITFTTFGKNQKSARYTVSQRIPYLTITAKVTYSPSNTYLQIYPVNRLPTQDACETGKLKLRLQSNVILHNKVLKVMISNRGNIGSIQTFQPLKKVEWLCEFSNSSDRGHYTCVNASAGGIKIRCLKGWKGTNCLTAICPKGCLKGACIRPGVCKCRDGWKGPACDTCVPREGCDKGCCTNGGDCRCYANYGGYRCDQKVNYNNKPRLSCYNKTSIPLPKPYDPNQLEDLRIFSRNLTIDVPHRFFPSAKVVIWFMHDGPNQTEFVSALHQLDDLQGCLSKSTPTTFSFKQKSVRPGRNTLATVKTTGKDVKCALAVSDVALDTFGNRGGVSRAQLASDIEEYGNAVNGYHRYDPYRRSGDLRCKNRKNGAVPFQYVQRPVRSIMPWAPSMSDSSTAFKDAGIFVLSNVPIITAPCVSMYSPVYYSVARENSPRLGAGRPMAVDDSVPVMRKGSRGPPSRKPPKNEKMKALKARVRSFFPETWIFELLDNPNTNMSFIAPDSMTTWKANMYCVSSSGLGISPPSKLVVFQPFYLQMALPYSLIRGETAKVPVKVFSYLKACTEIVLTMKASADLQTNGHQIVTGCLCSFNQMTAYFRVKPKRLGRIPIEVLAESRPSATCSGAAANLPTIKPVADAVRRQLLVEAEGIPTQMSFGDVLCPSDQPATTSFSLQAPSDKLRVVNDSQRAYVMWSGNVIGSSMNNLGNMVRMPYGCGEQNMMSMVPSIYVLDFFTKAAISKPDVMVKARRFIAIGYQRQLNYRLKDGSYSAFGERDKNGSTWLTAFVFKSFVAASRYADIDRQVMVTALEFLLSKTQKDGCFREDGRVFSSSLKGGYGRGSDQVSITAYILSALSEATRVDPSLANETEVGIIAARRCLNMNAPSTDKEMRKLSTYAVALRSYALTKLNPDGNETSYSAELRQRQINEDDFVFWRAQQKTKKSPYSRPWLRYTSADVETTAYALLTSLEKLQSSNNRGSNLVSLLPTVRWLTNQRNDLGGWYSTQDTVMALQALATLSTFISTSGNGTDITMTIHTSSDSREVDINKDNQLVVSKIAASVPNTVSVSATGEGCVLVQANVLFNVLDVGREGAPFSLSASVSQTADKCQSANVSVCARYTGDTEQSNMAVIKARMASGWEVTDEAIGSLNSKLREGGLKRVEGDPDRSLVLYFDYFSSTSSCVSFEVKRVVEVADMKPMLIQVYDYYSPDEVQEQSVNISSKACAPPKSPPTTPQSECPVCTAINSTATDAIARLCSKPHNYAAVERDTPDDELWRVTQRVGDMILTWNGAVKLSSKCECSLNQNAIVAVNSDAWWMLAMDEDIRLTSQWTVINIDTLSQEDHEKLKTSCAKQSDDFDFAYRITLRNTEKNQDATTTEPTSTITPQ